MKRASRAAWLLLPLLAAGCFRAPAVKAPGDPEVGVRVVWHGHSCFTLEDSVGRQILVDPFGDQVGYRRAWSRPDVVLVTHDHFDHNDLRLAAGAAVVAASGTHTVDGVEVTGLLADHDAESGRRHGPTRLYVWRMGGLNFAHMGDIGQLALTAEQARALKGVDILFIPVGGRTTVDAAQAAALVRAIAPRVAVPMHYGAPRVRFYEFDPVDPFLDLFEDVLDLPDNGFQLRRDSLPGPLTIYVPRVPD